MDSGGRRSGVGLLCRVGREYYWHKLNSLRIVSIKEFNENYFKTDFKIT